MRGLEPNSPGSKGVARSVPAGRTRHAPRDLLPRHPHAYGFAALVLTGGYVEAGDTGRHVMAPGDVLLHDAWESHLDRFDGRGAEVLVLPLQGHGGQKAAGCISDPDAIARLAERDRTEAVRETLANMTPKAKAPPDWPDQLADALREDHSLNLSDWASMRNLHPGSLSRGFAQVFGVTPIAYRLVQRTREAITAIRCSPETLVEIAYSCGFADQSHMCRAISRLSQTTPAVLRRNRLGND